MRMIIGMQYIHGWLITVLVTLKTRGKAPWLAGCVLHRASSKGYIMARVGQILLKQSKLFEFILFKLQCQ